jgi:hypothetical protein
MFDVLEHIVDYDSTLREISKHMHPESRLILSVPSYKWMWSSHDEFLHHKRRYTKKRLRNDLSVNFDVIDINYMNFFLFPLAAVARLVFKVLGIKSSPGSNSASTQINRIFEFIFSFEKNLIMKIKFPFGLSVVAVSQLKRDKQHSTLNSP